MGFLCEKITRAIQLDADEILLNINNFFQGMLIRTLGIEQIKHKFSNVFHQIKSLISKVGKIL